MSGIGFGPIYIPNLADLAKRIGFIYRLWFETCGDSPFAYLSYIGPFLNQLFWTAAPIDYKHAYKAAAGQSWVKTLRGVASAAASDAPFVAGPVDAFLDFAALADTAAWWWWVANGIVGGLAAWGSLAQLVQPCRPGRYVGYAIAPPWGLGAMNSGEWGPILWDPINNPFSFFGIRNGMIPKEYQLTHMGFSCGSIPVSNSKWFTHRLKVTPQFFTGPSINDHLFIMPDKIEPVTSEHHDIIARSGVLKHTVPGSMPSLSLMDEPPPVFPDDCTAPPYPPPDDAFPRCFAKTGLTQPVDGTNKSVVFSQIPDFKRWRAHPQFIGVLFEPQVLHIGDITLVVNGQCHWAFSIRH